jgi:hypothetical protein
MTYTLAFDTEERRTFLYALAMAKDDAAWKLFDRLIDLEKPYPSPALPQSGTEAARAVLAPPAPTDYFASDRKGNIPVVAPKGAEFAVRRIVGTAKTAKFMKVILANHGQANCFDSQLWPMIEKQDGKEAGLWISKSADGKYLNIVGVRQ